MITRRVELKGRNNCFINRDKKWKTKLFGKKCNIKEIRIKKKGIRIEFIKPYGEWKEPDNDFMGAPSTIHAFSILWDRHGKSDNQIDYENWMEMEQYQAEMEEQMEQDMEDQFDELMFDELMDDWD